MKKNIYQLFFLLSLCILSEVAYADTQADVIKELQASANTSEQWLGLVDKGDYGKSWDEASPILQLKFPKKEWNLYLEAIRKPLGKLVKRTEIEQRTAIDPPNMPKGDYIVMIYKSEYAKKKEVIEFVILSYTVEGRWRVLTYQLK